MNYRKQSNKEQTRYLQNWKYEKSGRICLLYELYLYPRTQKNSNCRPYYGKTSNPFPPHIMDHKFLWFSLATASLYMCKTLLSHSCQIAVGLKSLHELHAGSKLTFPLDGAHVAPNCKTTWQEAHEAQDVDILVADVYTGVQPLSLHSTLRSFKEGYANL